MLKGVNVYFTGYTDTLNVQQFKNLLYKHGAETSYSFSATRTTHIVCLNICASKMEKFLRGTKRRVHVVHPNWIIDSVKENQVQPESKYEILPTGKTLSMLDFVEREEKPEAPKPAPLSSSVSDSQEELNMAVEGTSTRLSLSLQECELQKSDYKRVSHPLLRQRRSAERKPKVPADPKNTPSSTSRDPKTSVEASQRRPTLKQQRFNTILKRTNVASAQKEFTHG